MVAGRSWLERLSSTTSVPPLVQVHLVSRRQHRRRHGGLGAPGTVTVGQSEAGAGHSAAAARVPEDARVPMCRVVEWCASRACTLCVPRAGLGCAHLTSQPHRGSTTAGPAAPRARLLRKDRQTQADRLRLPATVESRPRRTERTQPLCTLRVLEVNSVSPGLFKGIGRCARAPCLRVPPAAAEGERGRGSHLS